jgi:hypothetical protein
MGNWQGRCALVTGHCCFVTILRIAVRLGVSSETKYVVQHIYTDGYEDLHVFSFGSSESSPGFGRLTPIIEPPARW